MTLPFTPQLFHLHTWRAQLRQQQQTCVNLPNRSLFVSVNVCVRRRTVHKQEVCLRSNNGQDDAFSMVHPLIVVECMTPLKEMCIFCIYLFCKHHSFSFQKILKTKTFKQNRNQDRAQKNQTEKAYLRNWWFKYSGVMSLIRCR